MNKKLICELRDGFWYKSIFHYQGAALKKDAILVDDENLQMTLKFIKEKKITKVVVNLWSDKINSLKFLSTINHIEYLTIYSRENIDNQPIYGLKQLKFLNIVNHNTLDLSKLPKLQFLATNSPGNIRYLTVHKKLTSLKLVNTNKKIQSKDLDFLKQLKSLKVLYLDGLENTSIDGIQSLDKLEVLSLHSMEKLRDISVLTHLGVSLTRFSIENCKNIQDYGFISGLFNLKYLNLSRIRVVPSISFVRNLPSLKTFIFSEGTVLDNDMSYLKDVQDVVIYPLKKSYFVIKNGVIEKPKFISRGYKCRVSGNENIDLWLRIDN